MTGPRHPPASLAWFVWGLGALLYLVGFYQRVAPAVLTDRLMNEFAIGAAALGKLSAFDFYSYVAMQIPTGLIADRWGPRRLLTLGAGAAALGTLLFALAPSLWWAGAGRLLIGGSVAVAFVSMLKLASHWFTSRQFTLASGMALFVGIVGGVFAGVPLRLLVEAFDWRPVMAASACLTALLCAAIWLRVRDDPREAGYASHFAGDHGTAALGSVWRDLFEVFAYRNTWLLAIVPGGVAGAVMTFAGLWGVPWLMQVYGLGAREAAAVASAQLVAWALGGPILGTWSERLGRRKPLYVAACTLAALGWTAVVYLRLPLPLLIGVLLLLGFVSGCIIIGFAWVKESVMLLQPAVGWLLDRNWRGASANGARLYDVAAWQAGFSLVWAGVMLSLILILLTRETYCKQAAA